MLRLISSVALICLSSACDPDVNQACPPIIPRSDRIELVAPPFQQIHRGAVRMRFETRDIVEVSTFFEPSDALCTTVLVPESDRTERSWAYPEASIEVDYRDESGDHVLHTGRLDPSELELPAGERVPYTVNSGPTDDDVYTGTTQVVPAPDQGASVLLTGSLAPPVQSTVLGLVPDVDLLFLMGDLRRNSVESSSWRQLAVDLHDTQPGAYVHTVVGDVEDIEPLSRDDVFMRWFGGQGRPGGNERYFALDISGVRFLVLDAEDPRLGIDGSVQWRWMQAELDDVATEPSLREAIVVVHRGPHGLTEQVPNAALREELVPKLRDSGVRLLFSGHGHAYQRFDDGGLVVIDDGGGGAELGNVDHRLERDPDGAALRVVQSSTHGATHLEIAPDGGMVVTRLAQDGAEVDRVELAPPGAGG